MALKDWERELIMMAARYLLTLVSSATVPPAAVIEWVYKIIEKIVEQDWDGLVELLKNTALGPFAIVVAYVVMRGELKAIAREMERQSREPYERSTWVQRVAWVYDEDKVERVCVGGPYNPATGRAGSCSLEPMPGWVQRRVEIGTSGPMEGVGLAIQQQQWKKIRLFAGIRAEVFQPRKVTWAPIR